MMDSLDKTKLSKIKKIKYVYFVGSQLHVEEYPVVYINSEWFYYIKDKKGVLSYEKVSRLHAEYEPKYGLYPQFCLNINQEKVPDMKRAIEINQLKVKIETVRVSIKNKQDLMEKVIQEHIDLGKKLAELEWEQEIANKPSIDTP